MTEGARRAMVEQQLAARGITDERVLAAMAAVPREAFVAEALGGRAYEDHPLPIGDGQTISQPYMVARMIELARVCPTDRVLEIGGGSGYAAAILGRLARHVVTVELRAELAQKATAALARVGATNVDVVVGDGTLGWAQGAPYDAILVAAGAPAIPPPLVAQLVDGGRLIVPVGGRAQQDLFVVEKHDDDIVVGRDVPCIFVDLVGEYGWPA